MRRYLILLGLLAGLIVLPACDSYVDDVDAPIDSIDDADLTAARQVPFLVNGVLDMFAETLDDLTLLADGLSDAFLFDQDVPNATFPTYRDTDNADFTLDNNSVDGVAISLGEYRLLADTLLTRLAAIDALTVEEGGFDPDSEDDTALRDEAYFVAHLHGGISRYLLGTYFSLNPGSQPEAEAGGTINRSPLIGQADLYAQALSKMQAALEFADEYQARVVNSLIARVYLFSGDYAQADQFAANGMVEGDDPYAALYNVQDANSWWVDAGRGRTQFVADDRFADDDPRTPVEPIEGNSGAIFYRQAVYTEEGSPLPFMTWQENALMQAEVAVRDGDSDTALDLVNQVRTSFSTEDNEVEELDSVDLDILVDERDKTLFAQGIRLIDQRRFAIWHLDPSLWQFLPITERERNDNPNIDN